MNLPWFIKHFDHPTLSLKSSYFQLEALNGTADTPKYSELLWYPDAMSANNTDAKVRLMHMRIRYHFLADLHVTVISL